MRGSHTALAIAMVLGGGAFGALGADLRGRVIAESGRPVPGATVYIYEAAPRKGWSPLCPSCYRDCGKSRTSNGEGRFIVPTLSDDLIFRVLVVAQGFKPTFQTGVDPSRSEITVSLER